MYCIYILYILFQNSSMADSAKNWNKFTIAQLKAELGRRNLDVAGKKADLVNRLVQAGKLT